MKNRDFSISIQNFLKIPKIVLINSCDEFKDAKKDKTKKIYKTVSDYPVQLTEIGEITL